MTPHRADRETGRAGDAPAESNAADALSTFRSTARKMVPTKRHRAGIWENMLGTVYAMNPAGDVQYFDYDYAAAVAFVGVVEDVRVAKHVQYRTRVGSNGQNDSYMLPRNGQAVWFVLDVGIRSAR